MANKFYIGANPANFLDTVNWSLTHGGAGGQTLSNGDTAYVDYSASNIDGYDASAVTLAALYITKGYGRPVGSANPVFGLRIGGTSGSGSTPLKINATNVYIETDCIDTIILYGTFTNVYARLLAPGSNLYLQGGGPTNIEAGTNGTITVENDVPVSRIETLGAAIKLGTYATLPPVLEVNCSKGAKIESNRRVTHGEVNGHLWMREGGALASVNQVEKIGFDAASTGGNLRLTIQKPDGTFATTANIAWNATDATYLAAINSALDTSSGVVGGIVATATAGVDPDLGFTLTYSGTGYAGLSWSKAAVHTYPTTSTLATYTPVRVAGSRIVIPSGGVLQYDGYSDIGATSADIIRTMSGGLFDASRVITAVALKSQIISMGAYRLSGSITQTTTPRQPSDVMGGVGA